MKYFYVDPSDLLVKDLTLPDNMPQFLERCGGRAYLGSESVYENQHEAESDAQRLRKERTGWQVGDYVYWLSSVVEHVMEGEVRSINVREMILRVHDGVALTPVPISKAFHTREEAEGSLPAWAIGNTSMILRQSETLTVRDVRNDKEGFLAAGNDEWWSIFSSRLLAEEWRDGQLAWKVDVDSLKVSELAGCNVGELRRSFDRGHEARIFFGEYRAFLSQPLAQAWADAERAKRVGYMKVRSAPLSHVKDDFTRADECQAIINALDDPIGHLISWDYYRGPGSEFWKGREAYRKLKAMIHVVDPYQPPPFDLDSEGIRGWRYEATLGKKEKALPWNYPPTGKPLEEMERDGELNPKPVTKPWPQPGDKVWVWESVPLPHPVECVVGSANDTFIFTDGHGVWNRKLVGTRIHPTRLACLLAEVEREKAKESKEGKI